MVSFSWPNQTNGAPDGHPSDDRSSADRSSADHPSAVAEPDLSPSQAEEILQGLAGVFTRPQTPTRAKRVVYPPEKPDQGWSKDNDAQLPNLEARYRALVEQIPAVVFMAYLDRGIGEAYVSPQIEATLGFSQEEWLEDPVRWYKHIHPDDKQRWSAEAAEMFLTGNPLRSAYRVVSRDGRVIWFHCEAKMIRKEDGEPWFIHGVGFDITDLRHSRYRGRFGLSAGSGGPHHPLQPRRRILYRIFLCRSGWPKDLGSVHGAGRGGTFQGDL
jgi:PAS domain S-box-containing protein